MWRKYGSLIFIILLILALSACKKQTERQENMIVKPTISSEASDENIQYTPIQRIIITVGGEDFQTALYDNETAKVFAERIPMTLRMDEMNGNEKFCYLEEELPVDTENVGNIQTGDIMLFGSDCLVLFFDDFSTSYNYTKIGRIENTRGFIEALTEGTVEVSFHKGE